LVSSRRTLRSCEYRLDVWKEITMCAMLKPPHCSTGTVHSNIAYGREQTTREEVEEAARMANCDFIWDLPQGFDTNSE
jgi:ABC-type multidrug transport system fused ATPase/permease subunit